MCDLHTFKFSVRFEKKNLRMMMTMVMTWLSLKFACGGDRPWTSSTSAVLGLQVWASIPSLSLINSVIILWRMEWQCFLLFMSIKAIMFKPCYNYNFCSLVFLWKCPFLISEGYCIWKAGFVTYREATVSTRKQEETKRGNSWIFWSATENRGGQEQTGMWLLKALPLSVCDRISLG